MQVEIITDKAGFLSLQQYWDPLVTRAGIVNVFLTFEWLATWCDHFGYQQQLLVIVVRDDEGITGVAPLAITQREGFRRLGFIGAGLADYEDFIIAQDHDEGREALLEAIFLAADRIGGWDIFQLNKIPGDSANFESLAAVLQRRPGPPASLRTFSTAPYVSIKTGWEDYWLGLTKHFRTDSERQLRRLEREKGAVSYQEPTDLTELNHYLELLIKWHLERRSKIKGSYSLFEDTTRVEFYKDLALRFFSTGWLSMIGMRSGAETVAVNFGFNYAGKHFAVIPTFSEAYSRYSPGRLLLIHLVKESFDRGFKEFDMCYGDEGYKFSFKPQTRRLWSVTAYQPTMRGYTGKIWFGYLRPLLRRTRLRRSLVPWLRRTGIMGEFS
jgi:CelD/BcsL family acetyltransferase involved in cellulose biosynthesis